MQRCLKQLTAAVNLSKAAGLRVWVHLKTSGNIHTGGSCVDPPVMIERLPRAYLAQVFSDQSHVPSCLVSRSWSVCFPML